MPDLDGTPISAQTWDSANLVETTQPRRATITEVSGDERDQRVRVETLPNPGAVQPISYNNVQYADFNGALLAAAIFTGVNRDCLQFKLFTGGCLASSPGTLFVECSSTGLAGTWKRDYEVYCDSGRFYPFIIEVVMRYYRLYYVNGANPSNVELVTLLKRF